MTQLRIELLGTFQVLQNGRSLTTFRSDKIRGLLAYLAVESGRPLRRVSLAGLLWPQMDDRKALSNLRLSLHRLCQTLDAACSVLQIDRHAVCLDASAVWVDVLDFEQAFTAVSRHKHTRLSECPDCMRQLETAVALYRGDFLPGFFLSETAAFDEWVMARREWLLQKTLQTLTWLVDYHAENGRLVQAILYARRQLELEPWREFAHRQMMQFLAQTRQYAAAQRQYDLCQRLLREELDVEPDASTQRLYAQIRAEAAREGDRKQAKLMPLTLSATQRISVNLPATAAPFMGRQVELQLLEQLIANPSVRLVTIVGVGGMGKTRLAVAFAAAQAAHHPERFPHGITFVDFTAVTSAKHLLPTIAQTLAFMPEPDNTTLSVDQQLLSYLQSRQMLLVLDNFEQLLHSNSESDGTAVLLDLLQQAPQLTLLVTSRERLQLKAEHLLLLDGLAYPTEEELKNIDFSADNYAAVQLFQQSARRLQPNFTLTSEDYPHLVMICRLLDGMPLGLELAAAWVEWLPLAEIASEIHYSLDFLSTEERDWPDRHHDMRRIFDDSWLRLSQPEQTLFARLALFRDGFTRAAVQAVAGGGLKHTAVLHLLTSLVRKSFLRYNRLTDRYTLHELLRQYAAEQLAQQPDYADVQRQYALYYCRWLQQQAPYLQGERQKETLERIATDLENIRMAWEWAVQARVPALLADSAFSLGLFFLRNGRYTEGIALFSAAANQLNTDRIPEKRPLALARLWYWQAVFEPNTVLQQELLQDSLALLENDPAPEKTIRADKAAVLLELGIAAHRQGRHAVVDQAFKQSLTLYRLSDNQWGEGNVLFELGVRAWRKGDYPLSEQWFSHCLYLRQRLGDLVGTAVALEGLAGSTLFSGQIENAHDFLQKSYAVYQQLEDRVGIARLKIKQAQLNWYQNLDGLTLFEEGLNSLHELGARRNVALWTVIFAKLMADEDIEKAAQLAADGQKMCQELGHQRGAAVAQGVLSRAALVRGDYTQALELAEAYLHAIQTLSVAVEYSDALVWAGWAALALGHNRQAERYVTRVLQTANYWRVACLDLTAVLLAQRTNHNAKWAWRLLGFAEEHYAPHRGSVSQEIVQRFLPQMLLDMPPFKIAKLKAQGCQMNEKTLYQQLQTCFE